MWQRCGAAISIIANMLRINLSISHYFARGTAGGIVNLMVKSHGLARLRDHERSVRVFQTPLAGHLHSGYFIPRLKSVSTLGALLVRLLSMAPRTEVLANRPEGSKEALGVAGRCEAAHRALTLARGLVGVLCTVV